MCPALVKRLSKSLWPGVYLFHWWISCPVNWPGGLKQVALGQWCSINQSIRTTKWYLKITTQMSWIFFDFSDSQACAEHSEYTGYTLSVLLLVAFLPAIFALFLGIIIGYYLTVHKHSRFCHSHETSGQSDLQRAIEKTLSNDEEPLKQDLSNSPNSKNRFEVVVNELKANNSKQPNSSVESTLQKANLNFL